MIQSVQSTKSISPVKTAAKAVAATAVATGTILYLAKKGKLNPVEGDNIVIKNVKAGFKKPADFILKKGGNILADLNAKIDKNKNFSFIKEKLSNIGKKAKDFKQNFLNSDFKAEIDKKIDTLQDFVESKFNKAKFSGK